MNPKAHLIGLVGGMGWPSTALYYRYLNEVVYDLHGGHHSARCLIHSLNFHPVLAAGSADRWDLVADILTDAGAGLKSAGAAFFLLTSNSAHMVADAVEKAVGLPLLHIADATGAALQKDGLRRVGILGTRFVTGQSFYSERLHEKFGIEVVSLAEADRETLHNIIIDELTAGIITDASRDIICRMIADLQARSTGGVIIACTELPLILAGVSDTLIPCYDTARIHVTAALELAGALALP